MFRRKFQSGVIATLLLAAPFVASSCGPGVTCNGAISTMRTLLAAGASNGDYSDVAKGFAAAANTAVSLGCGYEQEQNLINQGRAEIPKLPPIRFPKQIGVGNSGNSGN